MLESHCRRFLGNWFYFQQQRSLVQKKELPSSVISMLGRIVCLHLDVREVGATAAAAEASLLLSSGFWPASPNVSHCSNDFNKKINKQKS